MRQMTPIGGPVGGPARGLCAGARRVKAQHGRACGRDVLCPSVLSSGRYQSGRLPPRRLKARLDPEFHSSARQSPQSRNRGHFAAARPSRTAWASLARWKSVKNRKGMPGRPCFLAHGIAWESAGDSTQHRGHQVRARAGRPSFVRLRPSARLPVPWSWFWRKLMKAVGGRCQEGEWPRRIAGVCRGLALIGKAPPPARAPSFVRHRRRSRRSSPPVSPGRDDIAGHCAVIVPSAVVAAGHRLICHSCRSWKSRDVAQLSSS